MSAIPAAPTEDAHNPLLRQCYQDLRAEKLVLPTLPEISLKIRKAINDEKANNARIARVVQLDPAITARLIHIANSPLYPGRKKIESCPEALTRIGLKAAQHLITSFALKSVFTARSPQIRKRMNALWAHSGYVAAICAVLAHKLRGFDPDRAMLAGLVHDIGCVPVLTLADRHPGLLDDPAQLDAALQALRTPVGVLILRQWDFPKDFEEAARHAEDWLLDRPGPADYTDLVILAQLHSFVGSLEVHKHPHLDQTPAYRKLLAGQSATELSQDVLDRAKDDIWQVQHLLLA
ncbi:HDOD domain-containing protein [Methylomagnum ishizawai]|uniref:HDOD domain-containing protein n=1 Tax=Methylomagnum ishizawai TaxID=1760988 RepID=UPI001C336E79|nr:HDOD domain-containing protein [Methylomagnum ishizawai]BBL73805.1 HDOD domain-containing protein [Methylomagnum ishizawai]